VREAATKLLRIRSNGKFGVPPSGIRAPWGGRGPTVTLYNSQLHSRLLGHVRRAQGGRSLGRPGRTVGREAG